MQSKWVRAIGSIYSGENIRTSWDSTECNYRVQSKADLIEKDDSGQLSSKDQVADLLVNIENLEAINKEIAILLETVKTENEIVSDKLDILEEKNKELENYIERLHKDTVKDVAIGEELSSTNFNFVTEFKCNQCGKNFVAKDDLQLQKKNSAWTRRKGFSEWKTRAVGIQT